jgi:predicted DNA-binding transcriptional regulator AlpA
MTTLQATSSHLLNEQEVATRLSISIPTVRRWRLLRQGPKYLKVGSTSVRYRPEDVESWLDSRPAGGSDAQLTISARKSTSRQAATEVPHA